MYSNRGNSNGVGLGGLLLVAFIVLKLTNVISWSWWWVLSPLWIGAIASAILVAIYSLFLRNR